MTSHLYFLCCILFTGCYRNVEASCEVPMCTCLIDGEQVQVEQNLEGNEALAGTVGALSSLLVTGSALGLYVLYQKRCKSPEISRQVSDLSNNKPPPSGRKGMSPPPPYRPDTSASRNIYRAGMKDPTSHRVGNRSATQHLYDRMSDWN
ncbi:uncharacterized protein LOC133183415 [Saccostrea echinata]|uniref:uncharacterized protein LOC133183415 n=1 Tax=Saccostrea echinata TaxID=191078 RepID=UPI002A8187D7|nr:uncharacterized protein LOC133183415 [Saccostrea echinata]